jgi:hypothetical protein
MALGLALLVATACSTQGGASGTDGVLPPSGTIWFGTDVTADVYTNNVGGLLGQADTLHLLPQAHFWFVGHLRQAPADWPIGFELNGQQFFPFNPIKKTSGSEVFVFGTVPYPVQQPATFSLRMTDNTVTGTPTELATGSVTVAP